MEEELKKEVDDYINTGSIYPYDQFKKLVPKYRALVLDRTLEQVSIAVAAERWGVTENTVRVWKHRLKIKDIEKIDSKIKNIKEEFKLSIKFTHCEAEVLTHLLTSVLEEISTDKSYHVQISIIEK